MSWLYRAVFGSQGADNSNNNNNTQQRSINEDDSSGVNSRPVSQSSSSNTTGSVESQLSSQYDIECTSKVTLSLLNPDRTLTVKSPDSILYLLRFKNTFDSEFRIYDSNGNELISQSITSTLPTMFDQNQHSIVWTMNIANVGVRSFHLKFHNEKEENTAKQQWQIDLYEHSQQTAFNKAVSAKDSNQVFEAYNDDVMMMDDSKDFQPTDNMDWGEQKYVKVEEKNKDQIQNFVNPNSTTRSSNRFSTASSALDADDLDDEEDEDNGNKRNSNVTRSTPGKAQQRGRKLQAEQNDNLAVGMAVNRTFVGRGHQLGVFKHDEDGQLQYITRVPAVKSINGTEFTPSKLMLAENDNKMIMLNESNPSLVYQMDIERGKVVAEFGVDEDWKIRNIGQTAKYAEQTPEQLIMGVNNNSIFTLDPRISGKNKLATKNVYQTQLKNSCLATTGGGNVAVASDKGEIRLYDNISKRAKSLVPGLGDPIIGLDVTEAGDYILATTKRYLLVIPTEIEGSAKDGFSQSLSSHAKAPIKLQLLPADLVKFNIKPEDISFTEAHFNTGENIKEEWIVTSTGPYIITWNFRKVKQNKRFEYKIKLCTNDVVADQFLYGHQDQVVVTLPDNVFVKERN